MCIITETDLCGSNDMKITFMISREKDEHVRLFLCTLAEFYNFYNVLCDVDQ